VRRPDGRFALRMTMFEHRGILNTKEAATFSAPQVGSAKHPCCLGRERAVSAGQTFGAGLVLRSGQSLGIAAAAKSQRNRGNGAGLSPLPGREDGRLRTSSPPHETLENLHIPLTYPAWGLLGIRSCTQGKKGRGQPQPPQIEPASHGGVCGSCFQVGDLGRLRRYKRRLCVI
jgi:hypothetical protein